MLKIFDDIQRIVEHIQQNTEERENWQNPGDKFKFFNIDQEDDIENKFEKAEICDGSISIRFVFLLFYNKQKLNKFCGASLNNFHKIIWHKSWNAFLVVSLLNLNKMDLWILCTENPYNGHVRCYNLGRYSDVSVFPLEKQILHTYME